MRRVLAAVLAFVFISQSSGMAVAGTPAGTITPTRPLLADIEFAATQFVSALETTEVGAMLTGRLSTYQLMHQPRPAAPKMVQQAAPRVTDYRYEAWSAPRGVLVLTPRVQRPTDPKLAPLDPKAKAAAPAAKSPVKKRMVICTRTGCATPIPKPSITPHPTPTPTAAPTATPTQAPTATPTPTSGPTSTPLPTPTPQPTFGPSTTGVNHYWTYEENSIPGVGRYMVNVGNGNLVVDSDDVDVKERGIDLAFQRTYNSFSQHDASNTDNSVASNYGNGWTTTFDAHIAYYNSGSTLSLYDIDGARYDYLAQNGAWIAPPGMQGTSITLTSANGQTNCYYQWTKKDGTSYIFYRPDYSTQGCGGAGFNGRVAEIFERNSNNYVVFNYSWDNGIADSAAHLAGINVVHQDGQQLTLVFQNVNGTGPRELHTITRPDGQVITYGYNNSGDLTQVTRPGNSSIATLAENYTYNSGTYQLASVQNPRYVYAQLNSKPADGTVTSFSYFAGGQVQYAQRTGVVNFTPNDGTSTALQGGTANVATTYYQESFAGYGSASCATSISGSLQAITSSGSTTAIAMSDTDGHATQWTVDGCWRLTQEQEWSSSTTDITRAEAWDTYNDLVAETDYRGNETDYAYDSNGNMTEEAKPQVTTSAGTFRPTSLYSYDPHDNVTAFCDAVATNARGLNWTYSANPGLTASTLCSATPGAVRLTWATSVANPIGFVTDLYTAAYGSGNSQDPGYHTLYTYDSSAQGGTDYGLPTSVTGDTFTQQDGTTMAPVQKFIYDGLGNLACYSKLTDTNGTHWWRLTYDGLNRQTAVADPDDASLSVPECSNAPGIAGSHIVTMTTYNPDGSVASTQTPSEYAAGYSTTFGYDADGNSISEIHHYNCTTSSCTPGETDKWYDGEDRVVEVGEPHDPTDYFTYRWLSRNLYDLTQNGVVSVGGSSTFHAYGGLYKTQQWEGATQSASPAWTDLKGYAYDGLDRAVTKYAFSPNNSTIQSSSSYYDQSTQTYGLLSQTVDSLNETINYAYDADGKELSASFGGDGGVTPNRSYGYDADGRQQTASSTVYGNEVYSYDTDGRLSSVVEPGGGGVTLPSTVSYGYYANGSRATLSVQTSSQTLSNMFAYSYRNDGLEQTLAFTYPGVADTFTSSFDGAGRRLSQVDAHGSQSWSYDLYGRVGAPSNAPAFTIPAGSYTNYSYDAEGQILSRTGYGGVSETRSYSPRGELTKQLFSNYGFTCTAMGNEMESAPFAGVYQEGGDGVMHPFELMPAMCMGVGGPTASWQDTNDQWDARTGVITSGQDGNVTYAFDKGGRQDSMSQFWSWDNKCGDTTCGNSGTGTKASAYDAENHVKSINFSEWDFVAQNATGCNSTNWGPMQQNHIGAQSASYGWGPNGHPIQIGASAFVAYSTGVTTTGPITYDTLHWDGDELLFTTNASAQIDDIKIGTVAEYVPGASNGVTVLDRDESGLVVSTHNNAGAGQWIPGSPYRQNCADSSESPTVQESLAYDQQAGMGPIEEPGLDGIYDGVTVIQGVRSMDATSGQWTTPDAYQGTVDDPMSQKSYMWNGNNSFAYEDPSGFETGAISAACALNKCEGVMGKITQKDAIDALKVTALVVAGILTDGVADELVAGLEVEGSEMSLSEASGMLRDAAGGKGNFGLGEASAQDADTVGRAWVGDGAKLSSDGRALVSKDGLRQYRFPSFKPRQGKVQANLEQRSRPSGQWQSDGHIDITHGSTAN